MVIPDSFVSRTHFRIAKNPLRKGKWMISDEQSATGTFVMLNDSVQLRDGTVLQMGVTEVTAFLVRNFEQQTTNDFLSDDFTETRHEPLTLVLSVTLPPPPPQNVLPANSPQQNLGEQNLLRPLFDPGLFTLKTISGLEVDSGSIHSVATVPMDGGFGIGRVGENAFCIPDQQISTFHAELHYAYATEEQFL